MLKVFLTFLFLEDFIIFLKLNKPEYELTKIHIFYEISLLYRLKSEFLIILYTSNFLSIIYLNYRYHFHNYCV